MDYLRISVTDRCNFRCQYCMPEDIKFQDKSHILTLEEMLTFAEACLELGVTKGRVTGRRAARQARGGHVRRMAQGPGLRGRDHDDQRLPPTGESGWPRRSRPR